MVEKSSVVVALLAETVQKYQLEAGDRALQQSTLGSLRVGMPVRLSKRDRALKPQETGHPESLAYGPGQKGVIVQFIHRSLSGFQFDMAVVRWDEQQWFEWDLPLNRMQQGKAYSATDINALNDEQGKGVVLRSFELPAQLDCLEPLQAADKAARNAAAEQVRAKQKALGGPRRTRCTAGTNAVAGTVIVFVRPGFEVQRVADDLGKQGVGIRRVWGALGSFSAESSDAALKVLLADARLAEVSDNCK